MYIILLVLMGVSRDFTVNTFDRVYLRATLILHYIWSYTWYCHKNLFLYKWV